MTSRSGHSASEAHHWPLHIRLRSPAGTARPVGPPDQHGDRHASPGSNAASPGFAQALRCYSGVMYAFLAQSAACNRAHHVDERCARWLLMTHDQAGGNEFPITQEFLAQMLGVSRPSVALSAACLHTAGLISYRRGQMTITDRIGLEKAACECYAAIRTQFDRVRALRRY